MVGRVVFDWREIKPITLKHHHYVVAQKVDGNRDCVDEFHQSGSVKNILRKILKSNPCQAKVRVARILRVWHNPQSTILPVVLHTLVHNVYRPRPIFKDKDLMLAACVLDMRV